eukprot:1139415_1
MWQMFRMLQTERHILRNVVIMQVAFWNYIDSHNMSYLSAYSRGFQDGIQFERRTNCPRSFSDHSFAKIKQNKQRFNSNCNNLLRTKSIKRHPIYPLSLFKHCINFWISSTHPNSNSIQTRTISPNDKCFPHLNPYNVRISDNDPSKYIHPRHVCYCTYNQMYDEWKSHPKTIAICHQNNLPSVPCKQWFLNLRPIFVYPFAFEEMATNVPIIPLSPMAINVTAMRVASVQFCKEFSA